jgi:hypothetical protein
LFLDRFFNGWCRRLPVPGKWAEWGGMIGVGLLNQAGYLLFFFLALAYEVYPG